MSRARRSGTALPGFESFGGAAPSSAKAAPAANGGRSSASRRTTAAKAASTTAATPAVSPTKVFIDGWQLDDGNPFGHRVCRAVSLGDDLQICLSVGIRRDDGPTSFKVPKRVLRWLLTGET